MKSASLIAFCLSALTTLLGAQQSAKIPRAPFHWNSNDSQWLDSADRVSQLKSLSLAERERILDALVPQFKAGRVETDTQTPEELRAEAAETRIKLVDLNGDNVPDVIAQPTGDYFCSPTGNCAFWVFMRSGPAYKLVLNGNAIQTFTIQQSKTNGFFDLVLGMHGSATEQELFVYRFVNGRYRRSACYDANWERLINGEWQNVLSPIITPCRR